MSVRECSECGRLWDEYTEASFVFVQIKRSAKMAQLRLESLEVIAILREAANAAAHRRYAALAHLKQHEATHQTRSAAAS